MIDKTSTCGIEYRDFGEQGPEATLDEDRDRPVDGFMISHRDQRVEVDAVEAAELAVKLASFARENGVESRATVRLPPHANEEAHARLMADLQGMTSDEFMVTLVQAGICTPDGKLTEYYASARASENGAKA